jgi:hypothetical protein
MTIFICTHEDILRDECLNCGGWLHAVQQRGFPGPHGNYCTEECAADAASNDVLLARQAHLHHRDLLCDCEEVCSVNGHPTAAEYAEYRAYREAQS